MTQSEQISEFYDLVNKIIVDFNANNFNDIADSVQRLVNETEIDISIPEIYPVVTPLLLVLVPLGFNHPIDVVTYKAWTDERGIETRSPANQLVEAINSGDMGVAQQLLHALLMDHMPILLNRSSQDIAELFGNCDAIVDPESAESNQRFKAIRQRFGLTPANTCYWDDMQRCVYPELPCIFIHTPKTAGSSLRRALAEMGRNREIPEEYDSLEKVLRNNKQARTHTKAHQLRSIVGETLWTSLFSFAFVRNPWNVMVSQYEWWHQGAAFNPAYRGRVPIVSKMDFDAFIRSTFASEETAGHQGLIGEWFDNNGVRQVDFVGKVENFEPDWQFICDTIGVKAQPMPPTKFSATKRRHYRSYYTDETREIVQNRYADLIKEFDYEF